MRSRGKAMGFWAATDTEADGCEEPRVGAEGKSKPKSKSPSSTLEGGVGGGGGYFSQSLIWNFPELNHILGIA